MRRHTEREKEARSTLQRQVEELQRAAGGNRLIEIEQNENTGHNIEGEQGQNDLIELDFNYEVSNSNRAEVVRTIQSQVDTVFAEITMPSENAPDLGENEYASIPK